VVSMGSVSKELCGGTHVRSTGQIGLFHIVEESSISAGVRRIEAITGQASARYLAKKEEILRRLGESLKAGEPARGQHFLGRAIALDGDRIELQLSLAQSQFMQGNVAASIATLEAALARHPGDSRVTYWLEEVRRASDM